MNLLHNLLLLIISDEAALKQSVLYWGVLSGMHRILSAAFQPISYCYLPLFDCMLRIHGKLTHNSLPKIM